MQQSSSLGQKHLVVLCWWHSQHEKGPSASSCQVKHAPVISYSKEVAVIAARNIVLEEKKEVVDGGIFLLSPRMRDVFLPAAAVQMARASLHKALPVVINGGSAVTCSANIVKRKG